jgi:tripartite motif-containing protein 71
MKNQNVNTLRIMSICLTILFLGLLSASITHATTENYSFVKQLGTRGTGYGQFQFPNCIAVDSSDNIYVADGVNCRIQKFDRKCNFITTWGSRGRNYGQFNEPYGIAVDSSGNVYTTEVWYQRVQKFDSNGNFITGWGSSGSRNGQFNVDRGIAVDSSGNVYVADSGNHRIQKFTSSGVYITQWGSSGSGNGQFYTPTDVAVDSSGNVYVADSGNNRIQKFDSNGKFITGWYSSGIDGGYFHNLNGVTIDSSDNVYAVDGYRIQKLTSDGKFIAKIALDGASDLATVDSSGNVYVTEHWSHCIKIYALTKPILPVANFTSNVTKGYAPLSVQFTDKSTGSPTSWSWKFGDGSTSTAQNPTHKYSKTGKYTVSLTVKNAAGSNTTTKTNYITVIAKPVAEFSATPTSGKIPLTVKFTDKSTGTPTKWKWTFGDGNTSTKQNPTYKYSKAGKYTVTLTVTNAAGSNTVTKTNYITVVAKPVAAFSASPTSGKVPLTVKFTDKSTGLPSSWKWTFGDGSTSTVQNPTHKYAKAGKYTVSLTVKNVIGSNTKTISNYITVK